MAKAWSLVLKRTVKSYSDKFFGGHGAKAYATPTARCQGKINWHQFIEASDLAKQIYGGPMPFTSFHSAINGRWARASHTCAAKALNQKREPWLNRGIDLYMSRTRRLPTRPHAPLAAFNGPETAGSEGAFHDALTTHESRALKVEMSYGKRE